MVQRGAVTIANVVVQEAAAGSQSPEAERNLGANCGTNGESGKARELSDTAVAANVPV